MQIYFLKLNLVKTFLGQCEKIIGFVFQCLAGYIKRIVELASFLHQWRVQE